MKKIIYLMIFLLSISFVFSVSYSVQLSYDNFMTVDDVEEIIAYQYVDDSLIQNNDTYKSLLTIDGISYNMSFDNTTKTYGINVTSGIEENTNIMVSLTNLSETETYISTNNVIKWRIPFYVDIYLWKKNGNLTTTTSYKNEFAYIYLRNWNTSYTNEIKDISYLDDMFSWVPLYGSVSSTKLPKSINYNEVFWAPYSNGKASIKLYEKGNYSMFVLTQDIISNINWSYEFIRPQTGQENYKGEITDKMNPLNIMNEEDQTFDVYFSMWEVNKMDLVWEFGKWILLIVVWICLIFVVATIPGGSQAAPIIAVSYWVVIKLFGWI